MFHFQALSGYWAINGLSARQATRPNRPDMLEVEAGEGVDMEEKQEEKEWALGVRGDGDIVGGGGGGGYGEA